MTWVEQEKTALVATFRSSDAEAPTLCEGWNVRRLLAHLIQREQRPAGVLGDVISRKPPGQEPGLTKLTGTAMTPAGYQELIDRFSRDTPRWSPMSWAAEKLNLVEYVIHHEDIRRAGTEPAEPRDLPEDEQLAIRRQLGTLAKLGLRKAPVGVRLATPQGESREIKPGDGVTLTGDPVELALWVSGRRDAAHVNVTGDPGAVNAFQTWARAK
ncbi:TIGR03085 family protein [Microlunatus elymi]|uniref:TIGR03085 family protein n=1 Tax=Microlunatus elymi TaxID=2596828 RepID=A0A516PTV3_9ACTN|nr:TIGR03085 family metal-binding protein [Microlunatus elymi]QDP94625.1 TIGR03085 family protein [Microlunatus elymi]